MIEQTKYQKLFSTPMLRFQVPEYQLLNEELLSLGEKMRAGSEGVSKSNRGGWHSEGNLFDSDEACIQRLRSLAETSVIEATRKITSKVDPTQFGLKLFWLDERQSCRRL